MECYYADPTLEPGEILVLVEWLDSFSEEVASWGAEDIPVFVDAKKRLLHQFDVACTVRTDSCIHCSLVYRSGSREFLIAGISQWNQMKVSSSQQCLKTSSVLLKHKWNLQESI